jgi:outer membrane autotransporter protein
MPYAFRKIARIAALAGTSLAALLATQAGAQTACTVGGAAVACTGSGPNTPAVRVVDGEDRIQVTYGTLGTTAAGSPGVQATGTGRITVVGSGVTTSGINAPGVTIVGDNDPVLISPGPVTTTGAGSNGIDVRTTSGNQAILAGPVTASGDGSSGIVARASGLAGITVVAGGAISAGDVGIDAVSADGIAITTQGAVSGATAGINAVSGTGTTIALGGALSSANGQALNVQGGPATVTVQSAGAINGRFNLGDAADRLTNNGTILAVGDSSFGAGSDALVNNGTIRVVSGPVTFAALESVSNNGLIDLTDGATNDTLRLRGNYSGSGAATLAVDVAAGGGTADSLIIDGAATGSTRIVATGLSGGFVARAPVVSAGAGTAAGAFAFAPTSVGFTDYSLVSAAGAGGGTGFALVGTPSLTAAGLTSLAEGAREVFYRGNDAVAAHLGSWTGPSAGQEGFTRAFWFQGFGIVQNRDRTLNASPVGEARSYDLDARQDFFGAQVGVDLLGGPGFVAGVTGGYTNSKLRFDASPLRFKYEAVNVGAYGQIGLAGFTVRGLVKYEYAWIDVTSRPIGLSADADGESWGGLIEAGYRIDGGRYFVEPLASIEYENLELDRFSRFGTAVAFDEADSLRGKAGLRFGAVLDDSPNTIVGYGKVQAIHEFEGKDAVTLTNTAVVAFENDRPDTYGRATVGLNIAMPSGVRAFIEGTADFAGDVDGGGGRAGLSIPF